MVRAFFKSESAVLCEHVSWCNGSKCHLFFPGILQIFLLAKINDELFLKIVEVKKIQGNVHIGTIKCQTREFFSVNPQVLHLDASSFTSLSLSLSLSHTHTHTHAHFWMVSFFTKAYKLSIIDIRVFDCFSCLFHPADRSFHISQYNTHRQAEDGRKMEVGSCSTFCYWKYWVLLH